MKPVRRKHRCAIMALALATLLLLMMPTPVHAKNLRGEGTPTPVLIDAAYAAGEITAGERLLYLAYAIYAPERLPDDFASDAPWSGTAVVAELDAILIALEQESAPTMAAAAVDELQSLLRTNAATVCNRSDPPSQRKSEHFHLNFDTIGGGLNINDYVNSLEETFAVQVREYGWAEPPLCKASDLGCANTNPWDRYPVQVTELGGGLYGYVTRAGGAYTGLLGDNPNTSAQELAAAASCMVLNRDYSGFPGSARIALRATAAHEFVHAIQFGYGDPAPTEIGMWYESTAAYAEDEVFDDANDNYNFLLPPFERCLGDAPSNSILVYHNWLFFRYAAEQAGGANLAGGGEELFERFWTNVAQGERGLTAYDGALAASGLDFGETFHHYAIAAGFLRPCPSSAPYCFEEAAGYAAAAGIPPVNGRINAIGGAIERTLENHFALNWIELPPAGPYDLEFESTGSGGEFRVSVVAETPDGLDVQPFPALVNGAERLALPTYNPPIDAIRVLAVITNQQQTSSAPTFCTANPYRLQISEPAGVSIDIKTSREAFISAGRKLSRLFWLHNSGTQPGSFRINVFSSQGWLDESRFAIPNIVTLEAGASAGIVAHISVPKDAAAGTEEITTLEAIYVDDTTIRERAAAFATVGEDALNIHLPIVINNARP